jgi:hypothetical protein
VGGALPAWGAVRAIRGLSPTPVHTLDAAWWAREEGAPTLAIFVRHFG